MTASDLAQVKLKNDRVINGKICASEKKITQRTQISQAKAEAWLGAVVGRV